MDAEASILILLGLIVVALWRIGSKLEAHSSALQAIYTRLEPRIVRVKEAVEPEGAAREIQKYADLDDGYREERTVEPMHVVYERLMKRDKES